MVKYDPKNWFSFLFTSHGSLMDKMWFGVMIMGIYAGILCTLQFVYEVIDIEMSLRLHGMMGVVLGLLLVFRTNTAYDRWWEGRKVWGALVNVSRNLALKVDAEIPNNEYATRKDVADLIGAFSHSLKNHLRDKDTMLDIDYLNESLRKRVEKASHRPNIVAQLIWEEVKALQEKGHLSEEDVLLLGQDINIFIDCLGKCERIKKTPVPIAYAFLFKRFVFLYTTTLPFGFIADLRWGSIPAVMLVFYLMVGIEIIGEEIEDPFGEDDNDLPTDEISDNIRKNVQEILIRK